MRYKPTDGVFNIRVLKYLSSSSIIPSDLFYAAVETMDFEGPDVKGPSISDCVCTLYNGKMVVALVYSLTSPLEEITDKKAISLIADARLSDDTMVVLLNRDNNGISEITEFECGYGYTFFLSKETKVVL